MLINKEEKNSQPCGATYVQASLDANYPPRRRFKKPKGDKKIVVQNPDEKEPIAVSAFTIEKINE